MEELKKTKHIVQKVLKEDELARKDDLYLIEQTLDSIMPGTGAKAREIHNLMREKKLPRWETVRRTRQKAQADYPELKDEKVVEHRLDKEKEYREFARC